MTSAGAEVELKIKLSTSDLEKVFEALSRKQGVSAVRKAFKSRAYYDTADLDLYTKGLSLRLEPNGQEQTLKIEAAPVGNETLSRLEFTDPVDAPQPSFTAVRDAAAREAVKPFTGKSLVHIFTAVINRRYFDMDVAGGTVELAFDVGALVLASGRGRQDFHEIEVELKAGSAAVIDSVKREIFSLAPSAEVQPHSKSAQGSRLYLSHR